MEAAGPLAQRFPLVARTRPPCTALPTRITALAALANRAGRDGDLTAASRVHNQAALIASDCAQTELARTWCHRHAHAYLDKAPRDTTTARHALEPLVNLARLHTRAGDGDAALALLRTLYQAVLTRTDTIIDDVVVPAAALTNTLDSHRELSQWLWSVQLADGTRALTAAGRWRDAETHLRRHNGIGHRMLDGRQVAVIACATRGEHTTAQHLLTETKAGNPWEAAVTACLAALARPPADPLTTDELETMINSYRRVEPDAALVVFRTRLALSIIDAAGDTEHPVVHDIARDLIGSVLKSGDGYAARDLLTHRGRLAVASAGQTEALAKTVNRSGLGQPLTATEVNALEGALASCERVITTRAAI
ncbi:hypothetical protein [Salinispora arenicola]|uniref:hypothetical protein n=1 Tax=Salinispora arenicola TaxID=168697 RepID=UPI00036A40BA|nr:hypothetical protein [Salinispora arenicola]